MVSRRVSRIKASDPPDFYCEAILTFLAFIFVVCPLLAYWLL